MYNYLFVLVCNLHEFITLSNKSFYLVNFNITIDEKIAAQFYKIDIMAKLKTRLFLFLCKLMHFPTIFCKKNEIAFLMKMIYLNQVHRKLIIIMTLFRVQIFFIYVLYVSLLIRSFVVKLSIDNHLPSEVSLLTSRRC